jgi:hypothetical protein
MAANAKIALTDYSDIRFNRAAAAAITPGHLVELTSADKVQVHANAGQNAARMFALEDNLQGKEISQAYAADDQVRVGVFRAGDIVNARLADGQNISIGDLLESAGDGTLQAHTPDTESLGADSSGNLTTIYSHQIVGVATEAVDMSGSSAADPTNLIAVMII